MEARRAGDVNVGGSSVVVPCRCNLSYDMIRLPHDSVVQARGLERRYHESFKHEGLKRFFEVDDRSKLPPDLVDRIALILLALKDATSADDMNRPSWRLHPLKGDRKGQWAVTVRANWRIVFAFEGGNAIDVDFVDYH